MPAPRVAGVCIVVESGNVEARVVISAAADPATVNPQVLLELARDRGVEITSAVADELSQAASDYVASRTPLDKVFAKATPVQHGERACLKWQPGFDPTESAKITPDAKSDGRVDYYCRQTFIRVREGDHVATVFPATPGTDGRDVTGRNLPATAGASLTTAIDPSIQRLTDGRLIALRDGRLIFNGRTLKVDPVLEIKGTVNFGTGNIDFDGDVLIKQDIRDRFRVKASGAIAVEGLVDACFLECGTDLISHRGIAGRNVGTISVGRDAFVGYLDQLKGRIKGSLNFHRGIMRCELEVGGDVGSDGGTVVGGKLALGGNIRVAELGSDSEPPTEIRINPALRTNQANQLTTPSRQAPIEVLRQIHATVTIAIGTQQATFGNAVKGPIRIWLDRNTLMFRVGDSEAQPLNTLRAAQVRAA